MKICVVFLLLICGTLAANVRMSDIRHQWRRAIAPFERKCIRKTGVKEETIDEFYNDGIMSDVPSWKCFLQCIGLKLKVFSSRGVVDTKRMVETFDYVDIPSIQKCAGTSGSDPCQKAYLFVKCIDGEVSKQFPL